MHNLLHCIPNMLPTLVLILQQVRSLNYISNIKSKVLGFLVLCNLRWRSRQESTFKALHCNKIYQKIRLVVFMNYYSIGYFKMDNSTLNGIMLNSGQRLHVFQLQSTTLSFTQLFWGSLKHEDFRLLTRVTGLARSLCRTEALSRNSKHQALTEPERYFHTALFLLE